MGYIIRDNEGCMIAEIPDSIANNFFNETNGYFKKSFTNSGKEKICFIVKEAKKLSFILKEKELKLYIWEDYILEPNF